MSTGTILLVAGDNLPNVQVALTNSVTGKPIDLSANGNGGTAATIVVKMREAGQTTILAQLPGNFITDVGDGTDGNNGIIQFMFAGSSLQVTAGVYEFEVDINFNGQIQTVFDILRARVRSRF